MEDAQWWIDELGLAPLPEEGGWYREVYRSAETIPAEALPERYAGPRCFSTAIYYLLKGDEYSALHRLRQDELWHFYAGSGLTLHLLGAPRLIGAAGRYRTIRLGRDVRGGERFQAVVPRGALFAATVAEPASFALVGCTVAPGFEFEDFEAPSRAHLVELYPEHEGIIRRLTR